MKENKTAQGTRQIDKIISFLIEIRKFQNTYRRTPKNNGSLENDAEHSWCLAMSCITLLPLLEEEFGQKLDLLSMLKMSLIHDIGEIGTGDTATWDTNARIGKSDRERQYIKNSSKELPKNIRDGLIKSWEEVETKSSLEAKIVKSLDRSDPVLHRVATGLGWKNVEGEHDSRGHLDPLQLPRHEFSEILTKFYENIRDRAIQSKLLKE